MHCGIKALNSGKNTYVFYIILLINKRSWRKGMLIKLNVRNQINE